MTVARQVAMLLPLALLLLTLPDLAGQGHVAVTAAAIAVLLATLATRVRHTVVAFSGISFGRGPADDERCLHGAFRRHSNPDTPGRPGRPRAPGQDHRPA